MRLVAIASATFVVAAASIVSASACGSFSDAEESSADANAEGAVDGSSTTSDGGGATDGSAADGPVADDTGDASTTNDAAAGMLKAFITAVGYADIVSATVADTKCTAEAAGRLPGKFIAWYPSGAIPAPARLVRTNGQPVDGPWFRVDGKLIAATRAALSNTATVPLANGIDISATGVKTGTGGGVWTGTLPDGGIGITCNTPNEPTTGAAGQTGPAWTKQMFFGSMCGTSLSLYCFQIE